MTDPAVLTVTGHLEVARRGAFVIGTIQSGTFRVGLQAVVEGRPSVVAAVEYVDHPGPPYHVVALGFTGSPTRADLQRAFPIGSRLEARQPSTTFTQLNDGWNAEPNRPEPWIRVAGNELRLEFVLNALRFPAFRNGDEAALHFTDCWRYRLGSTNDEGWSRGQCRFSRLAPRWGEFYEVKGDLLASAADDWRQLGPEPADGCRHFLFYLRDQTFECDASGWSVELPAGAARKIAT
jgi:hypothetical protein